MTDDSLNLAALISSRICHDLISPIGAVSNGLEMLLLSGTPNSPELELVSQSVANANARIRLFRLAFGVASADQSVDGEEVRSILRSIYTDGRLQVTWAPDGRHPRRSVRAALLALLCAEQAVPFGGQITVQESAGAWSVTATSDRLSVDNELWARLDSSGDADNVAPAAVQFLTLPMALREINRKITVQISDNEAVINF